jgi:hypothetical protein
MTTEKSPVDKFGVEVRALLNRWTEESDLDVMDMAEAAAGVINEWIDEDVVTFEADEDFFGDGEPG